MRGRSQPVGGEMQGKNSHNDKFIDQFVGKKIRFRRNMLKMSQKHLGQSLGVSFQQIQKYETGLNRVGVGRLKEIADILNVPIAFFYADLFTQQHTPTHHDEVISSREEYLLLKRFRVLTSIKRRAILQLLSEPNESF
ncbi:MULTISPECIES: helix-turn-helix domain-containing protein [unclassified Bartonella]|uniref:helix-turn-helix domain-containing protein n=1 Tax=unclassified Bartonella TaxID=2645622 RepID=UPI00235EEA43|nr:MULTISPECIES: helix-turn-helix transcriptional regulator [unclassified Bartonella]